MNVMMMHESSHSEAVEVFESSTGLMIMEGRGDGMILYTWIEGGMGLDTCLRWVDDLQVGG
jgi:hypothetical protein